MKLSASQLEALSDIHLSGGWYVQSNDARRNATTVAYLASLGLITTIHPNGHNYGNIWRLTPKGMEALHK